MTDYTELKRLAEDVNNNFPNKEDLWNMVCTPTVALDLIADYEQLKAENEALRKRIEDLSPFKGAPLTGPSLKCLACGGYHNGMQGLPCPNMRITAQAELPETRSGQIGAALSKGEQS